MDTDDVKLNIPYISTGPDGGKDRKRRDKDGKFKSAGGGASQKRKPPPPPDNTKKLILGAGLLLCIVSFIAIVLVVTGNYGSQYNTSMSQFTGSLQLEEVDNEFITWDEEYNDLNSPKSKELVDQLSTKLTKALKDEGIDVEGVKITKLGPLPPTTVKKKVVEETSSGRSAATGRSPDSVSFSPDQLAAMPVKEIEYKDMKFVNIEYESMGKPGKNAGIFAAGHGQWDDVADMIKTRMISQGAKVEVKEFKPSKEFMNTIFDIIESDPELVQAPPMETKPAESCGCLMNGYGITGSKICQCDSACIVPNTFIFGGAKNEFAAYTKVCYAAFYAGVIKKEGGKFEVISLKEAPVEAGPMRNGITANDVLYDVKIFKVKAPGPVAQVLTTTPSPPPTSETLTENPDDASFIMHLHFKKLDGNPVTYSDTLKNLKSPEASQMATKIQTGVTEILKKMTFNPEEVVVSHFLMPPSKEGVLVRVDVTAESQENIQNAVKLESTKPGSLIELITTSSTYGSDMTVASFRYGASYANKLVDKM